jgi:hypothetical protein
MQTTATLSENQCLIENWQQRKPRHHREKKYWEK